MAAWTPWTNDQTDTVVRFTFAPGSTMPDADALTAEIAGQDTITDPTEATAAKEKARSLMVARNGVVNAMVDGEGNALTGYALMVNWRANTVTITFDPDDADAAQVSAIWNAGGFSPLIVTG